MSYEERMLQQIRHIRHTLILAMDDQEWRSVEQLDRSCMAMIKSLDLARMPGELSIQSRVELDRILLSYQGILRKCKKKLRKMGDTYAEMNGHIKYCLEEKPIQLH